MSAFSGFEPEVGEIRAVRTFRVGPGGKLFPLFSKTGWTSGTNQATCTRADGTMHTAPDPECTCGFYAYAHQRCAQEYPFARYVLAVVACWGRVIAGTRGIRAQYARIEAIWFAPEVPAELADLVREHYPETTVYADSAVMLASQPLTALDTYDVDEHAVDPSKQPGARIAVAAGLAAGAVPLSWIDGLPSGWWMWTGVLAAVVLAGLGLGHGKPDAARKRFRLICFATLLWMIAPLAGPAGAVFLRLPLVQIAALLLTERLAMNRLAATFPAPI